MSGDRARQSDLLEELRPKAFAIAYRMLGSVSDAEDVVQHALIKLHQALEHDDIRSPEAFLATIVTRLCIDELRSARVQRETYIGEWLPEPLVEVVEGDAPARIVLAESVRTAFLVLLETLSPVQRAVFLLRDVFDYEYADIARIIGRTESNARQIAVRARAHVMAKRPRFDATPEEQDALVERFFAAIEAGDVALLETMLAKDVSLHGDGGGNVPALARAVSGRSAVARTLVNWQRAGARAGGYTVERTTVNQQPGALIRSPTGAVMSVWTIDVSHGHVSAVRAVVNPEKLRHIAGAGDFGRWLERGRSVTQERDRRAPS